ncbi:sensor histidine kinase [Sulfoacidibacillus ferrooxidans]|uniref:histidine kinase n=1 Tax=Sulfoacidibacillus ferrooxidans TaxID=2005001 RepID=A0A9X1V7U8_9BACL|nr:Oxygen sensor histidine kinase NreB [Sulfoacidibacillus ferrooxidans]
MKSLFESDQFLFKQMFDRAIDAYLVLTKELQVAYMNDTAQAWFGHLDTWNNSFCGDILHCQTETGDAMSGTLCLGCIVRDLHISLGDRQMVVTKKDGSTIFASISYSYIPVQDVDQDMCILMSIRDVSVQKKWENERLVNETLRFTLEERERIARDLHDTVAQNLAYATMQLKLLRKEQVLPHSADSVAPTNHQLDHRLKEMTEILDESIKELRNSLYDLTFSLDTNLMDFIREAANKLHARTGIQVETHLIDEGAAWSKQVDVQVARIVQEILTNIRKHAHAAHVDIHVERTINHLSIRISDDGRGFDVDEALERKGHYGLHSIIERCRLLGGEAAVEARVDKGTVWRLSIIADLSEIPLQLPSSLIES